MSHEYNLHKPMLGTIAHVGITVADIDHSIKFYRDVLGLVFIGELTMEGQETDRLFQMPDCKVRIAYLASSDNIKAPPIELIQFLDRSIHSERSKLDKTCISEVCFQVTKIEELYFNLIENSVECLSPPQYFDFSKQGFGKSKVMYFRDPDGIILEVIEPL